VPELGVFTGCERIKHFPLAVQLILNMPHAREVLDGRGEPIVLHVSYRATDFVNEQLDPQLRYLMLNDEQHLIMVWRLAERRLRRQQPVELQIARVIVIS
jgi:hypothetical protein